MMKKLLNILLININFFFFSDFSYAFTLNNNANLVFSSNEVSINIQQSTNAAKRCTNIGIDEHELLSIAQEAVDQYWNTAATSRLKLRGGSVVSLTPDYYAGLICNAGTSCDPNPALAVNSGILITCNANNTNFSSNGVLAVTVPNNSSAKTIIGSLIMINDQANNQFKTKSRDEKISIIAHEIGHAFGLGHSPVKDSLMYYATINMRTSLGSDDIDGISYLYPKQQPISCGSVKEINTPTNLLKNWLGFFIGLLIIMGLKNQWRYLKLRPRF